MRHKITAVVALVVLAATAGCSSETALDPQVGRVVTRHYRPAHEDCGYGYRINPADGKYEWLYGCDFVEAEWSLAVEWAPRRFRDDKTGKVRTAPTEFESGWQVDEGVYDDCRIGQWATVTHDGDVVVCTEGRPGQ